MRKIFLIIITSFLFFSFQTKAQNVTIEGYAFETGNRGYLNEVKITILEKKSSALRGEIHSNIEGFFTITLPADQDYILRASKKVFKTTEQEFTTKGKKADEKVFLSVELDRKPGYLFDVTLSEKRNKKEVVDAIHGAKIEVYNNTLKKEILTLEDYPAPNFNVTFEQGNHYTIMIRKKGFFTKRMEAYVNVKGCILCFDGVGNVRPGISDVMTKNNTRGTLLANVELDRVKLNKSIKLEKIYYDLAKWNIRKDAAEELDKLLVTLKDNPSIIVELGSHTDCRGPDSYNLRLSQKRADAAVNYLVEKGIARNRIKAKGYGETQLVNECEDGVRCSERRHQLNRRTELKIIGFLDDDPYANLSLEEIIKEEQYQKMLEEIQNGEIIQVQEGEELPSEIQNSKNQKSNHNNQENHEGGGLSLNQNNNTTSSQIKENIPFEEPAHAAETVKTNATPISQLPTKASAERPTQPTETVLPSSASNQHSGKIVSSKDLEVLVDIETGQSKKTNRKKMLIDEEIVATPSIQLQKVPKDYTGFKVQVLVSNSELPHSHRLFSQHGNLTMEETKSGGFAYLLGEFAEKKDAEAFLKNIITPRYPNAKVIDYFKGKRVN
ncbi:MAG TPA: OmpA family protein [Phaeodactylibacter sp.]|nr:OmpA family protein [Phaeodactylibacter sp.]